jgi:hypothetical protein
MPALVAYESAGPRPRGEVVLGDGSRIRVSLGADGVAIERLPAGGVAHELLFRASPDLAAWICVSLREGESAAAAPLDIILDLVMSLGAVVAIKAAFAAAATRYRYGGA